MKWIEDKMKDFYVKHLDIFIEDSFDAKLSLWQRILLRHISLKRTKK